MERRNARTDPLDAIDCGGAEHPARLVALLLILAAIVDKNREE